LSYKLQTGPDENVSFLGANIQKHQNGYIIISVFNETKARNFPVIRYTHGTSNSTSHQSAAIFNGQT